MNQTHDHPLGSSGSQHLIREAIRRIALGRSIDRVDMSPGGTGGVGTARLIHGYVAKVHDDPSDAEFEQYGGTIDVGEYPDETASTEPIIHKGVLLAGTQDNSGGVLLIPTLFSDVTIISDAATRAMYVVNFSHADVLQYSAHREVTVGVRETEDLDASNDSSPDYDELAPTGNEATTHYTAEGITSTVKNDGGKDDQKPRAYGVPGNGNVQNLAVVDKPDLAAVEQAGKNVYARHGNGHGRIGIGEITAGKKEHGDGRHDDKL